MEELLKRREELLEELRRVEAEIARLKGEEHIEELEEEILGRI
ncbi:hypothetical protein PM10SUCC1_11780 [Propionigenium maris DSM 9537]|uniref:Uncharacterized protein n=1 Tax=Propionigenium maris DSM 9537 TaxID=1123000 RepID=A0A9W6GKR5_9FUSO|nr:hypothetical protein [Propionigenium maris]GLI55664.1 hypothetical protein PM10SUCC1_11780 [Propionigenium maris DSM 9537]